MSEERDNIIVLVDDDGKESQFEVLDIIEDNEKRYAVGVSPEEDDDNDEGTVLIMKIVSANEEEDILEPIEDETELDHIFEIFKERMADDFEFEE